MNVRPLPPVLAEKARLELNEDPARVAADIQHLKDWIAKQPHLRARTDDQWLLSFLRGCKFSLERAKSKLDVYYTLKTTASDLIKALKFTDSKFMEILSSGVHLMLPNAVPGQPRTSIFRPAAWDITKYTLLEVMCVAYTMQEIVIMDDDNAMVSGIRTVCDCEGITTALMLSMLSSGIMKKLGAISEDAAPIRLKGAHWINLPSGFEKAFSFLKMFFNEKNKSRFYVHDRNYEEMYKMIPKEILPTEYGGTNGSIQDITDHWRRKIDEYAEFLAQEESFGTDESKRPGRPKTAEEMFGVDGSFRQLQID